MTSRVNESALDSNVADMFYNQSMEHLGDAQLVGIRDLKGRAAAIVEDVGRSGRPAVVTRRGKMIAVIRPLPAHAERQLLSQPGAEPLLSTLGRLREDGTADAVEADTAVRLLADTPPTDEKPPGVNRDWVVTMRDLNQQTSRVIGRVHERQEAVVITRHGRLLAALAPLPSDFEQYLLQSASSRADWPR